MIGPAMPAGLRASGSKTSKDKPAISAAANEPSTAEAGAKKRGAIGPSRPFPVVARPVAAAPPAAIPNKDAVNEPSVSACRKGDLPQKGWAEKWNDATKRAALVASIEARQMHVVYALRPSSSVWQESLGAACLEQAELDRLLRLHAKATPKLMKQGARDAIRWLLEEGAKLEVLCADAEYDMRCAAADILANLGEEAASRAAQLLKSENCLARATAAEALGMVAKDAEPHAAALAKLLEDAEPVVRTAAVSALGKIGSASAQYCAIALGSGKPRAREAAAEVLAKFGSSSAPHAAALAELLEDRDWQVPTAAANALKKIGPAAATHIAEVLGRCHPTAQEACAEALRRIGGVEAADGAAALLSNAEAGVRCHAARTLGALGQEAAQHAEALAPLRGDTDKEVRMAAREALSKLGVRVTAPLPDVIGNGDALPLNITQGSIGRRNNDSGKASHKGHNGKGSQKGRSGGKGEAKGSREFDVDAWRANKDLNSPRRRSRSRSRENKRSRTIRSKSRSRDKKKKKQSSSSSSRSRSKGRKSRSRTRR